MKKIAMILALLMVLSVICLTSCGKETTYETYSKAFEKIETLTDCDMTMNLEMKISASGISYTMPVDMSMKTSADDEGNPMLDMTMVMSMMGMEVTVNSIYADGWVYADYFGEKIKVQASYEEMLQSISSSETDMIEFTESDFTDLEFTEEDGIKSLTFTISGESVKDKLLESIGSLEDITGTETFEDVVISDVTVTLGIDKNGYLYKYSLVFTMSLTSDLLGTGEESEMTIECDIDLVYNNIGEPVTITVPTDIDAYTDMTDEMDLSDLLG